MRGWGRNSDEDVLERSRAAGRSTHDHPPGGQEMSIGRRLAFTLVLALSGTAMLSSSALAADFNVSLYTKTGSLATASNFTYQYSYYPSGSTTLTTYPATPATFTTNPQTIMVPTVSTTDVRVTFKITHTPSGVSKTIDLPGNRTVTTPIHLAFGI